jgi:hypothetical protein
MDFRWLPSFRFPQPHADQEAGASQRRFPNGSSGTSLTTEACRINRLRAGWLAPNRGVGRESLPIANGVSNRKRSVREHRTDPSRSAGATLPSANGPLIGPFQSQTVALIATLPDGICRQRIADLPPDTPGKALGRSHIQRCPSSIPPPSCCESVKSFSEKATAGAACNHLRLKVLKKNTARKCNPKQRLS